MSKVLAVAFFIVSLAATALAQDATKVDAKHYTVEFENSQVRVLRVKYGPNEKSVMHKHPNAVAVFLTDAKGKFNLPDGSSVDITSKAGQIIWNEATTHLPENTSDRGFEVIVIELKSAQARGNSRSKGRQTLARAQSNKQ